MYWYWFYMLLSERNFVRLISFQYIVEYGINYTFISVGGNSDSRLNALKVGNRSSLLQNACINICILSRKLTPSSSRHASYPVHIFSVLVLLENYSESPVALIPTVDGAFVGSSFRTSASSGI